MIHTHAIIRRDQGYTTHSATSAVTCIRPTERFYTNCVNSWASAPGYQRIRRSLCRHSKAGARYRSHCRAGESQDQLVASQVDFQSECFVAMYYPVIPGTRYEGTLVDADHRHNAVLRSLL